MGFLCLNIDSATRSHRSIIVFHPVLLPSKIVETGCMRTIQILFGMQFSFIIVLISVTLRNTQSNIMMYGILNKRLLPLKILSRYFLEIEKLQLIKATSSRKFFRNISDLSLSQEFFKSFSLHVDPFFREFIACAKQLSLKHE